MRTSDRLYSTFSIFAFILLILTVSCAEDHGLMYESLENYANEIKVIDTHEHQRWCEENASLNYNLSHLIQSAYLMADVVSAGGTRIASEQMDSMAMDEFWEINGQALDYTRNTSYYSHFIAGFQKLYDFQDLYFTASNIKGLSSRVEANYADYSKWFDEAFHTAGFELMFLDQYWNPFNLQVDEMHYALVFNINLLVMQSSSKPNGDEEGPEIYQLASDEGMQIESLDDYLRYCDHLFRKNVESRAVCVKNSMAYSRSLDFEEVNYEVARELFKKPSSSLSEKEAKMIQDFMFHWIIQKSIENDLPVQIHTGYLAGNGNQLDNGQPVKLNNLFLLYPGAKFVLFHGGYPWTGEYAAFGKMFANVYLDLVWLPQISREEAVHALDEMLDAVPYNKFFWGGDCAYIEESTGSLEFGKSVVTEVLAKRIERGLLTDEVARDIILKIFRENAIQVFALENRLERPF
ncbi:MAG: hypothetical protein DRI97_08190 [Bacteroidetes bacterium]|nr:MAG: hypothetical protein DRI97_08190 [Bacteroidota bacterium]